MITCICCWQLTLAQYTQVPDPNFEQALIDLGYDDVLDGQFLTANVQNVLTLNVDEKNIFDLTGIEAFVNLDQLFAFDNNINTIDLSLLPSNLWTLDLTQNNLTDIDLSFIPNVVNLYLGTNNFNHIDASNLTNVFIFHVSGQNLTNLNLTNCSNLFSLGCLETSLQTLDLTTCTNLAYFNGHNSQFTSLDFSGNPEVESILAYENPLVNINLPDNPMLDLLGISNTLLTELDITHCPNLSFIDFSYTDITQIDFSNNIALKSINSIYTSLETLVITHNLNLETVYMPWGNISGTIDFSGSNLLRSFVVLENPVDAVINTEGAPNLEELDLQGSQITELDLSQNTLLTSVYALECPNLQYVNIKNGVNGNFYIFATDNPQLTCMVVDDPNAENQYILVDEDITTLVANPEDCDNLTVNENELQNIISTYPNPVKNKLQINTPENITINHIEIYDVLGKQVLDCDNKTQLDVSGLASGLFFVHIFTNQGSLVKKIIKE